ncbi:hypothetical protein QR680_016386 [Steinernema hermaphroditum]|uniref:Secreted protein n=1 Tax=Steinernema hermaphroditum TaxID=289476 RepID=A0AA39LMK2_9BILA|nr:hypothetical protein QR680_016386 [Steinernema hermaphroditum]
MGFYVKSCILVLLLSSSVTHAFFPWKSQWSALANREIYVPVVRVTTSSPLEEVPQRRNSLAFQPSLAFSPFWVVHSRDTILVRK